MITIPVTLKGKVAVVTGASRGIGKSIALGLDEEGCTVYVTGRIVRSGDSKRPGSITSTAEEVSKLGGRGIAVACDHRLDSDTEAVFRRVKSVQKSLDVLANNATLNSLVWGPEKIFHSGSYPRKSGI